MHSSGQRERADVLLQRSERRAVMCEHGHHDDEGSEHVGLPGKEDCLACCQWFKRVSLQGYITSDCGAFEGIMGAHHYTNTSDATVAAALNAGMVRDMAG